MEKKPIRLIIADDHHLVRKALSNLIKTFEFSPVIYEAANGLEALKILASNAIDVVLLDIQMPVLNGMETIKRMKELKSKPYVLVLTQHNEKAVIQFMLQHGANGFLFKGCDPMELEAAVIHVMKYGFYYSDSTVNFIKENFGKKNTLPSLEISARELQVMRLMMEGKSNKEISKLLKLSVRTVESYRKALMKKTHSRNVADVVSLGFRSGMGAQ